MSQKLIEELNNLLSKKVEIENNTALFWVNTIKLLKDAASLLDSGVKDYINENGSIVDLSKGKQYGQVKTNKYRFDNLKDAHALLKDDIFYNSVSLSKMGIEKTLKKNGTEKKVRDSVIKELADKGIMTQETIVAYKWSKIEE